MNNIKLFFNDVLNMPYYGGSDVHQYHVEHLLEKHGFNKQFVIISKKNRDEYLRTGIFLDLPDNSYISQPCGTQDSPDFIVKYNNKLYFIECKSGAGAKTSPTYNSGLPKKEYIYIFTCQKYNGTTIFLGNDIISDDKRNLFNQLLEAQNKILEEFRKNPLWKDDRGFDYYTRDMYTQSGDSSKTDYFKHRDRFLCEQNVLNSL